MDDQQDIIDGLAALAAANTPKDPLVGHEPILVVDDDPIILEVACDGLQEYGYEVQGATSASSAIQKLVQGFKPQLICCDIVMPGGMNGVEMARKIREVLPSVKILLMSGYGAAAIDGQTNQDGFRILSKPYSIDEMVRRVRDILDGNA